MTIKLEIKDIWSSDVENVNRWVPDDRSTVFIQIYIAIGVEGDERADNFQLVVATPTGIRKWAEEYKLDLVLKRNVFVYREFSWKSLKRDIDAVVKKCESDTWNESVLKLQRYFLWEYEDYTKV